MKIENIIYFLKASKINNFNFCFKLFNRNIKIKKKMKNLKFLVYNGLRFIPVLIKSNRISKKKEYLIGSFSFSRSIWVKDNRRNKRHKKYNNNNNKKGKKKK